MLDFSMSGAVRRQKKHNRTLSKGQGVFMRPSLKDLLTQVQSIMSKRTRTLQGTPRPKPSIPTLPFSSSFHPNPPSPQAHTFSPRASPPQYYFKLRTPKTIPASTSRNHPPQQVETKQTDEQVDPAKRPTSQKRQGPDLNDSNSP
jgi:hypothetical protein